MEGGRGLLDCEYASGCWDYLESLPELGRFSLISGYCQFLHDRARILEIGCGDGLLATRICFSRMSSFTGIDVSAEAIARAATRQIENSTFILADACDFIPEGEFDLILFTECLEYFEDPRGLVRRYRRSLRAGGHVIVSMFVGVDTNRSLKIWKMLGAEYCCRDESRVTNSHGQSWIVRVLQPRGASS